MRSKYKGLVEHLRQPALYIFFFKSRIGTRTHITSSYVLEYLDQTSNLRSKIVPGSLAEIGIAIFFFKAAQG